MKKITVNDLTAEEKLRLICAKGFWYTEDFGGKIPSVCVSDGPVGLRAERVDGQGAKYTVPAVAYPSTQSLANTWSRECALTMGACLADDCIGQGVDILLAPGVNVKRHPLNGRNFEYFSEDPYLAGTLAKEYITGLQENGVGACVKHFCCNNLEYNRFNQSSEVDERTLRELYYKPFEIACEAKPVSAMCSYNRINGTYASEYKKGFDVLRGEMGFDGAVYSDWDSVRDRTKAAQAGIDIEFPFNEQNYKRLVADYEAGLLSDEALDACAARVLELCYRCEDMRGKRSVKTDEAERLRAAKRIADESMVLLKNDGVLPLRKGTRVAVCGCYARPEPGMVAGGGSSQVTWRGKGFDLSALLEKRLGTAVAYENMFSFDGVIGHGEFGANPDKGLRNAALADVQIVCAGTGAPFEYESVDRRTMRLPEVQERAILDLAAVNPNIVVAVFAGSAIDMTAWIGQVSAVVFAGFCGEAGGESLADILTGAVNPSGKLSESFPISLDKVPAANGYIDTRVTRYTEGLDVGYRYFDRRREHVLFPFGHGMSYSAFEYRNLKVTPRDDGVEVSYEVANTSQTRGKEISQIYVREVAPAVYRPYKELKEYNKDEIAAGKSATVKKRLPLSAFAHWSESKDRWEVTDGVYEILVGASSLDVRLRKKILIEKGRIELVSIRE
ncbi:MAG: glycoside hydrolase family 3 C-terminal domain-containing protein [Clostridia bacterium]|nr:glycoside hydrolase family 3 C-terminal domain-containing protein [Clostridia bacterium]